MRKKMASKWFVVCLALVLVLVAGCGGKGDSEGAQEPGKNEGDAATLTDVTVVLDWTPNTNHTGLYVAKAKGFYEQQGLNVEIIQPGAGGAEAMVASDAAAFGVSYQETVTQSRLQQVPIVSIAAVIQHNTSGYGFPIDRNVKSPKDFEGKTYSGYGSPTEEALLRSVMQSVGADWEKVKMISTGTGDFFTSIQKEIDFALIYYAWTGVEAELRNEKIDVFYLKDYSEALDFYTPILITNEKTIQAKPELVKAFMKATSQGYELAIENPEEAANLLLEAVPDLDRDLVVASQKWLAPRYQDDAPRWGEQKRSVWANYADWMYEQGLLDNKLDVDAAFTNDFLP